MTETTDEFERGALLLLPNEAASAWDWLVVAADGREVTLVPTDGNPLVGSQDLALLAGAEHDRMTVRIAHEVVVPRTALAGAVTSQRLPAAAMDRIDERRARAPAPTALQTETDANPEHRAWIDELTQTIGLLAPRPTERGEARRERRPRGPHRRRGRTIATLAVLLVLGAGAAMILPRIGPGDDVVRYKGPATLELETANSVDGTFFRARLSHPGRLRLFGGDDENFALLADGALAQGGAYVLTGTTLPLSWTARANARAEATLRSPDDDQIFVAIYEAEPATGAIDPSVVRRLAAALPDDEAVIREVDGRRLLMRRVRRVGDASRE